MQRRDLLGLAALPWLRQPAAADEPAAAHPAACTGSHAGLCALAASVANDGTNTHALLVQRGGDTLAEAYYTGMDRPSASWWPRSVAFDGRRIPMTCARSARA